MEGWLLVVEDNPDTLVLLADALSLHARGLRVVTARDGVEALDLLRAPGPAPALVLLDLKLPRVDGIEVLQALRTEPRTRSVPVVVFTLSDERRDVAGAYAAGANAYVRKPVDFAAFREAVGGILAFWLGMNVPPGEGGGADPPE
jgi:two-component system, response regulator